MTTAQDKLRCAMRELVYRQRVYPRLVASRRISRQQADREIELMAAIVEDYAHLTNTDADAPQLFVETKRTVRERG